jgi:two-component sensor histidine kinase
MSTVSRFASSLEKLTSGKSWQPYALAVLTVFAALLVREVLVFTAGINLFAVFFLPAVVITGLACGLVPALFAAILATFVPLIHLVGSNAMFFPSRPSMVTNIAGLAAINLFLAVIAASHRSYRKRIELTMRELNHRTKNLLSVIVSITHQLARNTSDIDAFETALTERLRSISIAHDLLIRNEWNDTSLHSAVALAIAPFSTRRQVAVEGPDVMISPAMVENIMMALHELLTNSAKYGALSTGWGKIRIRWRRIRDRLYFSWDCTGPRQNEPLSREGFGTVILTEVVPKNLEGHARYKIKGGRVLWVLNIPWWKGRKTRASAKASGKALPVGA